MWKCYTILSQVQQIFGPELVVIPLYEHLLSSKLYIVTGAKALWDILSHMWSLGYSCYTYKKKEEWFCGDWFTKNKIK